MHGKAKYEPALCTDSPVLTRLLASASTIGACKTRVTGTKFARRSRIIGGVNTYIHVAILPSVVECRHRMKLGYNNYGRFAPKIG